MQTRPQKRSTAPHGRRYRAVLFALFAVCAAVTVVFSVRGLIPFPDERVGKLVTDCVPRLAVSAFLLFLLPTSGYGATLCPAKKGLLRGLLWSVPCFLVAFANFPYSALVKGTAAIERPDLIWLFLLKCLSVALLEELFFRALLVPFVRERVKGRLAAGLTVLITGAAFGLVHLVNLFGGAVGPTFLQVGYTFLLGCMFAAMLLKTGNVWLCVAVHFLFDVGGVIVTDLGSGHFQDGVFWALTVAAALICAAHVVYTVLRMMQGERSAPQDGEPEKDGDHGNDL